MTDPSGRAPAAVPLSYATLWRWALLGGLCAGWGEVAIVAVQRVLLGGIVDRPVWMVWMAPLVDVALFAAGLLAVLPLLLLVPRLRAPRVVLGGLATAVGMIWLLTVGGLHHIAVAVLGLGVGTALSRVGSLRAGLLRPAIPRLGIGVGTGAILVAMIITLALSRGTAQPPPLSPEVGARNVLILLLDTVRGMSVSAYGYPRPTTPRLDAWGRTGVRFARAIAPAPWTLPSHASLFTGHWPREMEVDWRVPMGHRFPTLAERFAALGYRTGAFMGNLIYGSRESGLARGFRTYSGYSPTSLRTALWSASFTRRMLYLPFARRIWPSGPHPRRSADSIRRDFLQWLNQDPAHPFFAFLNFFDAHDPYVPPAGWRGRFGAAGPAPSSGRLAAPEGMSPEELRRARDRYDEALASIDAQIGTLLDTLDHRGILERTLLVIVGDHGEQFGEHDLFLHANSLYAPVMQVPLWIRLPGVTPSDAVVQHPVSIRDVAATIWDMAGLPGTMPGTSLASAWTGTGPWAPGGRGGSPILMEVDSSDVERGPVKFGDMTGMVGDSLWYIVDGRGREEVFNVFADPDQRINLVGQLPDSVLRPLRMASRRGRR